MKLYDIIATYEMIKRGSTLRYMITSPKIKNIDQTGYTYHVYTSKGAAFPSIHLDNFSPVLVDFDNVEGYVVDIGLRVPYFLLM